MYNLFPRHFVAIDEWTGALPHARDMAFNAVFVNPFHETGFSGSLYSIKDYFRLNPLFLRKGQDPADFTPLAGFITACRNAGLDCVMDLVINHTAIDSPLVKTNPRWYKRVPDGSVASPFAVDPDDPAKITVWGDLASIDNENSPDRERLWQYWDAARRLFTRTMGITGFRCDAAYQVPPPLWKWLIDKAKNRRPGSVFYAETLGCRLDQVEALRQSGFDYLFNSVKWWNYDKSWALDQHAAHKPIAPSIGFAESHDTERLASVYPGTREAQKGRYAFAAMFSQGLLMPMGFEFGATTRTDVVRGTCRQMSTNQSGTCRQWIGAMNRFKLKVPVLSEEGSWRALSDFGDPFLFLEKSSDRGEKSVYLCVNKNPVNATVVDSDRVPPEVRRCSKTVQLMGRADDRRNREFRPRFCSKRRK
jgi:starch synthase (maltosyl-transferring)